MNADREEKADKIKEETVDCRFASQFDSSPALICGICPRSLRSFTEGRIFAVIFPLVVLAIESGSSDSPPMPKGMITQAVAVLFGREVNLQEIRPLLAEFKVLSEKEPQEHWEMGGPAVVLDFLPKVNGRVVLDVVNQPWPDDMGSDHYARVLFGAWSLGLFGPFTFSQSLDRAMEQAWNWPEAREVVKQHKAFVRMRLSYVFGAEAHAPVLPPGYQPVEELMFLTKLAQTLLQHPDALCFFNPNGEILANRANLAEGVDHFREQAEPPFPLWTNVRVFKVNENWLLMDTIGNGQVDVPDLEMAFPRQQAAGGEVANTLRKLSRFLLNKGPVLKDGDTIDGPGKMRWQVKAFNVGIYSPPRKVLRWLPFEAREIPPALLQDGDDGTAGHDDNC